MVLVTFISSLLLMQGLLCLLSSLWNLVDAMRQLMRRHHDMIMVLLTVLRQSPEPFMRMLEGLKLSLKWKAKLLGWVSR